MEEQSDSGYRHVCRSGRRSNVVALRRFRTPWREQPPAVGSLLVDGCHGTTRCTALSACARTLSLAANPLTTAKPLTYGRIVAHRYLVEGRVIADRSSMAGPLQSI